ncbi:MAG: hypothetical protein RIM84_13980 [Alphaproteobacteria bacterium]
MFMKLIGPTAMAAVLAASVAAQALTITNRDAADHQVILEDDEGEQTLVVGANASSDAPCPKGCVLILGDGEPMEFEGNEIVTIEGGKLVQ